MLPQKVRDLGINDPVTNVTEETALSFGLAWLKSFNRRQIEEKESHPTKKFYPFKFKDDPTRTTGFLLISADSLKEAIKKVRKAAEELRGQPCGVVGESLGEFETLQEAAMAILIN